MSDLYVANAGSSPTPAGVWDGHYTDLDVAGGDSVPGDRIIVASDFTQSILRNSTWGGNGSLGEPPVVVESAVFDSDPLVFQKMEDSTGLFTIIGSPWLWTESREWHGCRFNIPNNGTLVQMTQRELYMRFHDCRFQGAYGQFQLPNGGNAHQCRVDFERCEFTTTNTGYSRIIQHVNAASAANVLYIRNCSFLNLGANYSRIIQATYTGGSITVDGVTVTGGAASGGVIGRSGSGYKNIDFTIMNTNLPSGWSSYNTADAALEHGDVIRSYSTENSAVYPGGRPIYGYGTDHQDWHGLQTHDVGNYRTGGAQMGGAGTEFSVRIQKLNAFSGQGDFNVGRLSPFMTRPDWLVFVPSGSTELKVYASCSTSNGITGQNFWIEADVPKGSANDAGAYHLSSRGITPATGGSWNGNTQQVVVTFDLTALGAVPAADCMARVRAAWCGGQNDVINVCPAVEVT
jgi:hypothetical protein